MQEEQRRPVAAKAREHPPNAGIKPFGGKTGKQIGEIGGRCHIRWYPVAILVLFQEITRWHPTNAIDLIVSYRMLLGSEIGPKNG